MHETYRYTRMIKRKAGLTAEHFKAYWLDGCAESDKRALANTPIRRIVKDICTGEVAMGGAEPPFDGMLSLYFDSLADAQEVCAGGKLAALFPEDSKYLDASQEMISEEYRMGQKADADAVLAGPHRLKIIRTVFRRNDLSPQQFKDYWLKNHSKLEEVVVEKSPVVRIVATFAVPGGLDVKAAPCDGMAELYFRSVQDIRAMFASSIPAMMREDEENFVQMDAPAIRFVADEFITAERRG